MKVLENKIKMEIREYRLGEIDQGLEIHHHLE